MFTIPDSSIIVNAEFFNDYNIETSYYTGLTGEVQFVNIGKNQYKL